MNLEVVYHVLRHFVDIKFDHLLWFFLLEADNFYFFVRQNKRSALLEAKQ